MTCSYPHLKPLSAYRYGCRCERCKAANSEENKRRNAAKRQYEREHAGVCPLCGGRMWRKNGKTRCCAACYRRELEANCALVEKMWADGFTAREIGRLLGWSGPGSARISALRARGWNLPHRHKMPPAALSQNAQRLRRVSALGRRVQAERREAAA